MSSPLPVALLACALLMAPRTRAQPVEHCLETARPIELGANACARPPEIRVGVGLATVLLFDTPLERVEVSERGRYRRVAVVHDVLTLVPSEALEEGTGGQLTVHFSDGAAPSHATFLLVLASPARVERQVEVYRRPRTAASYQRELREALAEVERLREENARLRSARPGPGGLTALVADGRMDEAAGISVRPIEDELKEHAKNSLEVESAQSLRAKSGGLVVLRLWNPPGAAPWQVESAALVDPSGVALRVEQVWQRAAIEPGEGMTVVVEVDAMEGIPPGSFTLTLWASGGERPVILRNVLFP